MHHKNSNQKRGGLGTLILDNCYYRQRTFHNLQVLIHQEDKTITIISESNKRPPTYMNQN